MTLLLGRNVLLAVHAAFTGLILFTIFALGNPYRAPGALPPEHFIELLAEIRTSGAAPG